MRAGRIATPTVKTGRLKREIQGQTRQNHEQTASYAMKPKTRSARFARTVLAHEEQRTAELMPKVSPSVPGGAEPEEPDAETSRRFGYRVVMPVVAE